MLTCDALRNRLLAEPDPTRAPMELRGHVDTCTGCQAYLTRFGVLHSQLAILPAPTSDEAKLLFLDSLTSAGPIIKSVPAMRSRVLPFRAMFQSIPWKPLVATAAAAVIGLGIYSAIPKKTALVDAPGPRHPLLQRVVACNTRLATTGDAKDRIATLSDLATDLRYETRDVYKAAQAEDLATLAALYEKVVADGIVPQAGTMTVHNSTAADRRAVLTAASEKLAVAETDAAAWAAAAPPHAKPSLARIVKAANTGRANLKKLADGEGS